MSDSPVPKQAVYKWYDVPLLPTKHNMMVQEIGLSLEDNLVMALEGFTGKEEKFYTMSLGPGLPRTGDYHTRMSISFVMDTTVT